MKSLILSMAFISTSFFSVNLNNDFSKVENTDEIYEDALYCNAEGSTSDGGSVSVSCWFCDCADNIRELNRLINDLDNGDSCNQDGC